jgi:ABC-type uncharacterized transport system involved in gliding motility auxiliary subunit
MNRQSQLRLSSNITIVLLLLLFSLSAWLSTRYFLETDMTRSGRHTLSEASLQILSEASKPIEISAYARRDSELRDLIRKYVAKFQRHKSDISLHFVNPDAVPDETRRLGIKINGELVLRYDGQQEHVKTNSEQEFVDALQRLLRKEERWLAFLEGHGERNPGGKSNHDLSEWVTQLRRHGFMHQAINLVTTNIVPDNTSVLIIASPLVALLDGEIDIIASYIERGGNLLWLLDPGEETGMNKIGKQLGIQIERGVIIDSAGQLLGINDPSIALTTAQLYTEHPITDDFDLTVFFPKATAIGTTPNDHWHSRPVLLSGNHTWLELGELQGEVDFDSEQEKKGPLTIGLSLERQIQKTGKQQRVMIVGDGDFLSNTYVGNSGNMELGMRIINWLSNDDRFIKIPQNTSEDSQLIMSQTTKLIFGLSFLFILPACFLSFGFFVWWRRKNL